MAQAAISNGVGDEEEGGLQMFHKMTVASLMTALQRMQRKCDNNRIQNDTAFPSLRWTSSAEKQRMAPNLGARHTFFRLL